MNKVPAQSIANQLKIIWALLKREIQVIKKSIASTALNSFSILCADTLIFRFLLPQMGLPQQDVGPIFIGSIIVMITILGVVTAEYHAFDLSGNRFIDYLQTLPLSLPFLFFTFALINIIRTALVGLPLFICGVFLLGDTFVITYINWLPLLIVTILSFLFISLFALSLVYYSNLKWYIDNVWPCILSPILTLGALLFTFSSIKKFSPLFAMLFACNPLTYIAEGIRATLIGGPLFIGAYCCIIALIAAITLCSIVLIKNVIAQLDPVYNHEHK